MQLITPTKPLLAGLLLLGATQAHATLTSYNVNGVDLVYSSVSDVTWTKDASLLRSMFVSQGFNNVVGDIIATSPTITNTPNLLNPTGVYTIRASDFDSYGVTTWFGAMTYVNYLNSINYAGSNQWRLPTVIDTGSLGCNFANSGTDCGFNVAGNGSAAGNELSELYYQELGGKGYYSSNGALQSGYGMPNTATFDNERWGYWSGTEYMPSPLAAWMFSNDDGLQTYFNMDALLNVWVVSPGQISVVPEPDSFALLFSGLSLLGLLTARRKSYSTS